MVDMERSAIHARFFEEGAFDLQPNRAEALEAELAADRPEVVYRYQSEDASSRVAEVVRSAFVLLTLPVRIPYRLLKRAVVAAFLLSSCYPEQNLGLFGLPALAQERSRVKSADQNFSYARIGVEVDGYLLDALVLKNCAVKNKRWTLISSGNGATWELHHRQVSHFLTEWGSHGVFFNYPGVGRSEVGGVCDLNDRFQPSKETYAKAYQAVLRFLEEGGATEIIGMGSSLGGGVQGEALRTHQFQDGINYLFVKDESFSDLAAAAYGVVHQVLSRFSQSLAVVAARIASLGIKLFGCNIDSVESSQRLAQLGIREVIIQASPPSEEEDTLRELFQEVHSAGEISEGDGVITAEASLGKELLRRDIVGNKTFYMVSQWHTAPLPRNLLRKIVQS